MRMGRVKLTVDYVVDLDNDEMVANAKMSLYEDIMTFLKFDELHDYIDVVEDCSANEDDIADFLMVDVHDYNEGLEL